MAFELPQLPYPYDALEAAIDAQTMEIHHTKHHQTYVNNLNAALEGTEWENRSLEDIFAELEILPRTSAPRSATTAAAMRTTRSSGRSCPRTAAESRVGALADAIGDTFGSPTS
jgi:superoxide dismutase